jgi:integrase
VTKVSKKRGNNEGSIYQRKDGRWVGQVLIGIDLEGKPSHKYIYGETRKEVADKLAKALTDVQNGKMTKPNKLTLEQWLDQWMDIYQEDISTNFKFRRKELIALHIKPALGKKYLTKLIPSDIKSFYNELSRSGRKDGKGGLATGTIRQIHNILKGALDRAVENQLVPFNIMSYVKPLKIVRTRKVHVFTKDEAERYLNVLKQHRLHAAFVLDLSTGLRRGELLGLQWSDLDPETNILKIQRQVSRIQNEGGSSLEYAPLKTASSYRQIVLPPITVAELKTHRKRQAQEKLLAGKGYNDEGLMFCTKLGNKLDTRHLYRVHSKALVDAKIEHTAFHNLRHTVTTWLVENNEPITAIQSLTGHSNLETLLGVYSHETDTMKENMADTLGSLMKDICK